MNGVRGEITMQVNGEARALCLTLGALAEIETAFGAASLCDLADRLKRPRAGDVLIVLGALLRGGGGDVSDDDLRRADIDIGEAITAVGAAMALTADAEDATGA